MKKTTLNIRFFTIIGLLMIATSFSAQNLLVNGNFEATTGWTKNNGDIILNEKNANSIHPDKDANELYINGNCRMPGLAAARFITQPVEITTSGTYTFKFTARIQNAVGLSGALDNNHATLGIATVKGEIFPIASDGTVGTTALATISTQSNTNTEVSTTVAIDAAITKVQVKIGKDWNVPYIDDVYFGLPVTGINDLRIENLSVASSNGILSVDCSSMLVKIDVIDTTGKIIQSNSDINANSIQLTNPLKSGLYMIFATDNHGKTAVVKHLIK